MSSTTGQMATTARVMSPATRMVASVIKPLANSFSDWIASIGCQSDGFSYQNVGANHRSGGSNHQTIDIIYLAHRIGDPTTKCSEKSHCVFS